MVNISYKIRWYSYLEKNYLNDSEVKPKDLHKVGDEINVL